MSTNLIIPITSIRPYFEFSVDLDLESYKISLRWNETAQKWFANLLGITTDVKVNGIAITTGIDLLKPFGFKDLGELYCLDLQEQGLDPDYDNLGTRYILVYVTKE